MKNHLALLAALAVSGLVACGGTGVEEPAEALGTESSALVTCATTCATGTLSCQGNTCSASDGAYVECDGLYQHCPLTPSPAPECLLLANHCGNIAGKACSPNGRTRDCCLGEQLTGDCFCSFGIWACSAFAQ
ncbi:hypothetical protein LXT21_40295 [Myxococcus sp. K38C18041901]|uniref:hypothetical protein n=1 Tax=Myxococcus guangdongensis TaxID=2906760 RepID=UPI0020A802E8|nr:hypothetical protein [Myxococcus guangdongensis]MCP3065034.1 hypothetical protein [Myxococcus guangdongensis]